MGKIKRLFRLLKRIFINHDYTIKKTYINTRKKIPIHQKAIFYEAYHGNSMTGNPLAIFTYLLNDPRYNKYEHIWALADLTQIPEELANNPRVTFVAYRGKDYAYYLARAKYLINNTTFPYFFHKRQEQVYANTWHGTPLKKMGMDINNKNNTDHKNIQHNFLCADYLVSPNMFTAKTLLTSHDIYNLYNGQILDSGSPRVDMLFSTNKQALKAKLQIPADKKVILYAPTWRPQTDDSRDKHIESITNKISDEYIILMKGHHFSEPTLTNLITVQNDLDTNKLLAIVDILITDYSSVFFEFLPTKKPVIFFTYDKENYLADRGLYINLQELPGPICTTPAEVSTQINQIARVTETYREKYTDFINTYCYNDDGKATERFIDVFLHNKPSQKLINLKTDKTKILIYGGGFLNNGITAAVTSLLNTIDYTTYDVTLIDHGTKQTAEKRQNLNKLNDKVNIIYRSGSWNATLFDSLRNFLMMRTGLYSNFTKKIAPTHLYKNELERITGLTTFDIGIDFSGYSPFWSALFSFGNFKKKSIFLHSDMKQEANKQINKTYPHRKNLQVIFSLYNFFDNIISVSKLTHKQNVNHIKTINKNYITKMDYVLNSIDYERILTKKNNFQTEFATEPHISLNEKINFITIGRLSPEKDHEKLLRAFAQVTAQIPNCQLYIVGDGVLKSTLVKLVSELKLINKVIFTGQLDNPYTLLSMCDCLVLASNHEGQPIVLLEALILNIPAIATDIPGSRSVLGDGHGQLVENSVAGLTNGMLDFIQNNRTNKQFNYVAYQNKALTMFYEKVCDLT